MAASAWAAALSPPWGGAAEARSGRGRARGRGQGPRSHRSLTWRTWAIQNRCDVLKLRYLRGLHGAEVVGRVAGGRGDDLVITAVEVVLGAVVLLVVPLHVDTLTSTVL